MRPIPKPTFMISLQKNYIRLIHDVIKEFNDFYIFNSTINIITTENIQFIIRHTVLQILLQNSITAMNITNMMNPFVTICKINRRIPNSIQFIGLEYSYTSRNALCLKSGVHLINSFFWNLFVRWSKFVTPLTFLNGNTSHINAIHSIPICLCHILVSINIRCLRISCINYNKLSTLHSGLKHLEQKIPYQLFICLTNTYRSISLHDG